MPLIPTFLGVFLGQIAEKLVLVFGVERLNWEGAAPGPKRPRL